MGLFDDHQNLSFLWYKKNKNPLFQNTAGTTYREAKIDSIGVGLI
jgi:hypothetical protein